jgi:hypothetical protein
MFARQVLAAKTELFGDGDCCRMKPRALADGQNDPFYRERRYDPLLAKYHIRLHGRVNL